MGKGACVNHNHNHNHNTIIDIVEDEITVFGLPAFFSYPINKPISTLNGKQKLKQIKNNIKKQKKQEKKLNQIKYLNIFDNDKNNISFSSSSSNDDSGNNDHDDDNDDGASSSNTNGNDDENENKNKIINSINNNNFKELIENDELIIDKKQEEKEKENEKEELYIEKLIKEIEYEENEFIEIFEDLGELIQHGEEIEYKMINKKRYDYYQRSCKKNKGEKINPDRWVKSIEENKEARKRFWLSFHYEKEKDKTPKYVRLSQLSFANNPKSKEDSYESQLRKALSLSASEYDRQLKNTIGAPSLSQNQINDILNRELTSEDYELLLLLDDSVKPKTVDVKDINRLPLVVFDSIMADKFNTCMICLSNFDIGETITKLHCDHIFHTNCISNWLSLSSTKCPIDGISINDN